MIFEKENYTVHQLKLSGEDNIFVWFLRFSRIASERSGINHLPLLPSPLRTFDKKVVDQVNLMIGLFDKICTYPIESFISMPPKTLILITSQFLNNALNEKIYEINFSNEIYFLIQVYASILIASGFDNGQASEIVDYFRLCLYLPVMSLQTQKNQLFYGVHSEKNVFLTANVKVALPTIEYFQRKSSQFKKEGRILSNAPKHELDRSNMAYFIYPMLMTIATLDETDDALIPQFWQHSSFIENREIPKMSLTCDDYFKKIEKERKYAMPTDGVTVQCKNYGDIQSVFLKEKQYRHIENLRVLYAKVTFVDGLQDLVILFLSLNSITISPYKDIFEGKEDIYSAVVLKIFTDYICTSPVERVAKGKGNAQRLGLVYREKQRETVVYLPRSVTEIQKTTDHEKSNLSKIPHFVNGHLRRLPPHMQASDHAKKLAYTFGFSLPNGYTFISPYETGQKDPMTVKTQIKRGKIYVSKLK